MENNDEKIPKIVENAKDRILKVVTKEKFRGYGIFNMILISMFELAQKNDIDFPHYYTITRTINTVLGKKSGGRRDGKGDTPKAEKGGFDEWKISKIIYANKEFLKQGESPQNLQLEDGSDMDVVLVGWTINLDHTISYPETSFLFLELVEEMKHFRIQSDQIQISLKNAIKKYKGLSSDDGISAQDIKMFENSLAALIRERYLGYDLNGCLITPNYTTADGRTIIRKEKEWGLMNYLRDKTLFENSTKQQT